MTSEYENERDEDIPAKVDTRDYARSLPRSDPSLDMAMNSYLWSRQINPQLARHNYWYPSRSAGDDQSRMVIPGTSRNKYNKFWQARYIGYNKEVKRYQSPFALRGDSVVITYPIRQEDPDNLLVVEGPIDALAASAEGGVQAIALLGIRPSEEVLRHVRDRAAGRNLVLAADKDAEAEMVEVMVRLFKLGLKEAVRVVTCSPWKDFAAASSHERRKLVNQWFTIN